MFCNQYRIQAYRICYKFWSLAEIELCVTRHSWWTPLKITQNVSIFNVLGQYQILKRILFLQLFIYGHGATNQNCLPGGSDIKGYVTLKSDPNYFVIFTPSFVRCICNSLIVKWVFLVDLRSTPLYSALP